MNLTELYIEDESAITEAQLKAALRRATIDLESISNLLWFCSQRILVFNAYLNGVIEYLAEPNGSSRSSRHKP